MSTRSSVNEALEAKAKAEGFDSYKDYMAALAQRKAAQTKATRAKIYGDADLETKRLRARLRAGKRVVKKLRKALPKAEMPTAERAARGEFVQVTAKGGWREEISRCVRDCHADAVSRAFAQGKINGAQMFAALRFATLARIVNGPVRMASMQMGERLDRSRNDDGGERYAGAWKAYHNAVKFLHPDETKVLLEVLWIGNSLGEAAAAVYGGEWKHKHSQSGAAMVTLCHGLWRLAQLWGYDDTQASA